MPRLDEAVSDSISFSLSCCGATISSWSNTLVLKTAGEYSMQLVPGQSVVIGRQNGGALAYLDDSYVPTPIVPNTGQSVLANSQKDIYVSRGHFMLRGSAQGIVLINGVPDRDGGVRPPTNWTYLLSPEHRLMEKAEEYLVERGTDARIQLPNGASIVIRVA
jgi:hypothetical protein